MNDLRWREQCRKPRARRRQRESLQLEMLENRCLLAADPIISEFMADNATTLADEDGDYSDWIEIHNPDSVPIDLTGWHLTDDADDPTQWPLPSVVLNAGDFLTVFASGKDRSGPQLHTNFNLNASGEFLALTRPDGSLVHAYAPSYPAQSTDVSYGVVFNGFALVDDGSPAEVHIPSDDALGTNWTQSDFVLDEESWIDGNVGVGFGLSVPGLTVNYYKANTAVGDLATAEQVIANTSLQALTETEIAPVINYHGTGGGAHYGNDNPFPTQSVGQDVEDFVIEALGSVIIPTTGPWTFGVNSDDGFSLELSNGSATHTMSFPSPRAASDTLSTFNITQAGLYELRLVMYERGGGAEVEMFAAQGSYSSWNATNFDLVGDTDRGGLAVVTSPDSTGPGTGAVRTDIGATMHNISGSAYIRIPFTIDDTDNFDSLSLEMKYNDGFVAYLNGSAVAMQNAPSSPTSNSVATAARDTFESTTPQIFNLTDSLDVIQPGLNILAIHGLNVAASDDTFLVAPKLTGGGVLTSNPLYFADPTPGTINGNSSFGVVADTRFSVDRGFFDAPFFTEITTATEGATIRYTTDGSEPTETHGTVYSGPIEISQTTVLRAAAFKPGFDPTNVDTHTYLFAGDVVNQNASPAGFPTTWGGTAADYELDPDVLANPTYAASLVDGLKSLPVMSLTLNVDDVFGPSGIYTNSTNQGVAWERAASFEYFSSDGGGDFQVNAGLRMYGGVGRNAEFKKHSFRILFKDEYGATKLRYPLFGDDATDRFDTLILRANFNDAWVWGGAATQFVRDEFMGRMQNLMGEPGRHGDFVHLYINGLYWGLYNPVERPDTSFSATYFGGDKDNWDGINSGEATGESQTAAWNTLMSMAPNLGNDLDYQRVQGNFLDGTDDPSQEAFLDVDNYITYLILNFWGGNNDWVSHNWYAGRERGPDSEGFKSYSWDAEWTMGLQSGLNENSVGDTTTSNYLLKPYTYLRNNAEFRLRFADHVHRTMFNDGALTPASTGALYESLVSEIEAAIVAESARWGDVARAAPYTPQDWQSQRDYVQNTYLPQRTGIVLQQLVSAGLYPNVTAPQFQVNGMVQHGGTVQQGDTLAMSAPVGTIYYTLDGSDPRALYGDVASQALVYSGTISLGEAVQVKSRVLANGQWSALNEAIYVLDTPPPPLRITEIMYNPASADINAGEPDVDNDQFEYLELANVGSEPIAVDNLRFTAGIDFDFSTASLTTIAPGQQVLIVRNASAFEARYGTGTVLLGEFANDSGLNNGGEQLRLESTLGQVFHDFEYDDRWYPHTDGEGFSLTILDPQADLNAWDTQAGWRPSAERLGSPGTLDVDVPPGAIVINEVLTHTDAATGDWIELLNTSDVSVDLSGWFVSDDPGEIQKYAIPSGTNLGPGEFLVLDRTQHFGNAIDPGTLVPFGLSELGDEVVLSSVVPGTTELGGYRVSVSFAGADKETTFGRHVNSAGYVDFVATVAPTPGSGNSAPVVAGLVMNELMYHPS
ncbi:MAG: lamin tail domain-containing protein, partial [Planctomycetales bacterium]|nr:lamin tail domain-containing protein [Planctomycetales bacterium]